MGAATRGADREKMNDAWKAVAGSTRPPECMVEAEYPQVMMLARRIREAAAEADALDARIAGLLAGDATYECLLTIPGIGPKRKEQLLKTFKSLTAIGEASLQELERHLPKDAAAAVYHHFHKQEE